MWECLFLQYLMVMSSSAHSLLFTLDLISVEGNCKLCVARDVMMSLYQQLKFLFLILDSWASHVECVCFWTMFLIFISLSLKTSWMVEICNFFVRLSFSLLGSLSICQSNFGSSYSVQ
jgi:hypothetical protein